MSDASRPAAAFAVSLVAGVLILVGGLMGMVAWMAWGGMSYWGGGWGMMGPMMMGWWLPMWFSAFSVLGLVSGIVIIASAMMLQNRPSEAKTWGTLILVFSVVSLFGMGGFLIGAILGIVGGILALTWRAA